MTDNKSKIVKKMLRKFAIAQITFTLLLCLFFFGSWVILSQFTWYGDEFIYGFLVMIAANPFLYLIASWIVGVFIVSIVYYQRVLKYLGLIAEASELIASRDEQYISLPEDLRDIEIHLNQVKSEAINSENLAREAEKRKNDLVVYLAHDLKTPLTSVIGYLALLHEEQQISEELREKYLGIALDKANRLEDLINEFFEITRFNLSALSLNYSSTNITRMIEQITYEFTPLLNDKNLKYNIEKKDDIEILCDVDKMSRVLDNMIRNAINYSYNDSIIDITIKSDDQEVFLIFENSGKTLAPENLKRIFEQFYRLDTARTSKTGGAGLGLAIAKEIIEAHKGSINATSANEKITFTISLPML